tara:strand:+ start:508 stop:837 length:330 start_codon:yes stop_codon:yes gene_type:complete
MILWEVFDFDDLYERSHSRRRFYTSVEDAVTNLLEVYSIYGEPCIRVWDADHDGLQYVLYVTNGDLTVQMGGVPSYRPTINNLKRLLKNALAKRRRMEKKSGGSPGKEK